MVTDIMRCGLWQSRHFDREPGWVGAGGVVEGLKDVFRKEKLVGLGG